MGAPRGGQWPQPAGSLRGPCFIFQAQPLAFVSAVVISVPAGQPPGMLSVSRVHGWMWGLTHDPNSTWLPQPVSCACRRGSGQALRPPSTLCSVTEAGTSCGSLMSLSQNERRAPTPSSDGPDTWASLQTGGRCPPTSVTVGFPLGRSSTWGTTWPVCCSPPEITSLMASASFLLGLLTHSITSPGKPDLGS